MTYLCAAEDLLEFLEREAVVVEPEQQVPDVVLAHVEGVHVPAPSSGT